MKVLKICLKMDKEVCFSSVKLQSNTFWYIIKGKSIYTNNYAALYGVLK